MENSKFGFSDIVGIVIALIVFGLGMKFIPDQTGITKSIMILFSIRVLGSLILAILVYFGLAKILIPTDAETASADRKKKILTGIRTINEFGLAIGEMTRLLRGQKASMARGLGTTISNIARKLTPDETSTKANGLFVDTKGSQVEIVKLVNKIKKFHSYLQIVNGLESGEMKSTQVKRARILDTFYSKTLPDMVNAMDKLEIILDSDDVSAAEALANTIEDLLEMDGLLDGSDLKDE